MLESVFNKVQAFRPATLLKRDPNIVIFLLILRNFKTPILKNICAQLLLEGSKGNIAENWLNKKPLDRGIGRY